MNLNHGTLKLLLYEFTVSNRLVERRLLRELANQQFCTDFSLSQGTVRRIGEALGLPNVIKCHNLVIVDPQLKDNLE